MRLSLCLRDVRSGLCSRDFAVAAQTIEDIHGGMYGTVRDIASLSRAVPTAIRHLNGNNVAGDGVKTHIRATVER